MFHTNIYNEKINEYLQLLLNLYLLHQHFCIEITRTKVTFLIIKNVIFTACTGYVLRCI